MASELAFWDVVNDIRETDDRFRPQAYAFLMVALQHTVQRLPEEVTLGSGVQVGALVAWDPAEHFKGPEAGSLDRGVRNHSTDFAPVANPLDEATALAVRWADGEIRQLIVEQKTCRPHARAECRLDGGGHGYGIAHAVDDGEMAGACELQRGVVAHGAFFQPGGHAGGRLRHGLIAADQATAGGQIAGIE